MWATVWAGKSCIATDVISLLCCRSPLSRAVAHCSGQRATERESGQTLASREMRRLDNFMPTRQGPPPTRPTAHNAPMPLTWTTTGSEVARKSASCATGANSSLAA